MKVNAAYRKFFGNQSRFAVLRGGAGSGKSVAVAQKLLLAHLQGKLKTLALRKTQPAVRRSVFALFQGLISEEGLADKVTVRRQEMEIEFPNGGLIMCGGLDDPEKVKSIEGISRIWLEEATEFTEADYRQLNLRMRGGGPYKQMVLTFNPVSERSWIKRVLFDEPPEGVFHHHSTHNDNAFLDAEYRAEVERLAEVDADWHRIYTLGEWGQLRNIILRNWTIDGDLSQRAADYDTRSHGLDFGFNHPSVLLGVGMKDGELCVFREFCAEGLTHDELERELLGFGGIKREAIIADSAEPARIKQMRTSGFRAKGATKGPDSVAAGIDFLRAHKIRVHPSCVRTIAELGSWKYREDKEGNVYEEPVPETAKVSFDAMAALRYAVEPFRRNVSDIVTPTGPRVRRSSKRAAGI